MIGLFLIYFIGRSFYNLAGEHKKSKWGFAILGIVSYYLGTFLGGVLIAVVIELVLSGSIDEYSDTALAFMAFPLGLATCWLFHFLLKRHWTKRPAFNNDEALDSDLIS